MHLGSKFFKHALWSQEPTPRWSQEPTASRQVEPRSRLSPPNLKCKVVRAARVLFR